MYGRVGGGWKFTVYIFSLLYTVYLVIHSHRALITYNMSVCVCVWDWGCVCVLGSLIT